MNSKPSSVGFWAGVLILCALPLSHASAAVKVYLNLENIPGDVSPEGGQGDSTEIVAWEWSMGVPSSEIIVASDKNTSRSGTVIVRDLSVTAYNGRATAGLIEALTTGRIVSRGTLTLVNPMGVRVEQLELENVSVTSLTTGVSAGADRPTSTITLRFNRFKYTFTDIDPRSGEARGQFETQYDIQANY